MGGVFTSETHLALWPFNINVLLIELYTQKPLEHLQSKRESEHPFDTRSNDILKAFETIIENEIISAKDYRHECAVSW